MERSDAQMHRRAFLGHVAAGAALCAGLGGCKTLNLHARLVEVAGLTDGRAALGPVGDLKIGGELKVVVPGVHGPVLVARIGEDDFRAVAIACTHRGSEVGLVVGERKFRCTNHGAEFAFDGSVLRGPATRPLASYTVVREKDHLYLVASS
jgi:cytochrome b6-f complex iron-sulfur subunit